MIFELLFAATVQCPDGSPPPCVRAATAHATPAIDQRRIAILPFRVTAVDTLYGAGLAELLSSQVGSDEQLRAAHMGTVLRVWRRAGGSTRTPLDQAAVQRVARELGAGRIVDGSIVGLGSRLTLSASVTTLPAGTSRRVGPFSGPADSLESMVGRLAAGLLGAAATSRVDLQVRLTDSPDAMRAYLEGLAHFRSRDMAAAGPAFERALGLDSGFARAAWMRYVASTWGWNQASLAAWAQRVLQLRARLSSQDQILVTSLIGDDTGRRTPARHLADRERAAALLPENPEALYHLGDYLFHSGAAHGRSRLQSLRQSIDLLERSVALDTQATVVQHLLDVSLFLRDTARLRAWWPVFDRLTMTGLNTPTFYGLMIAEVTGDPEPRASALRRPTDNRGGYRSYVVGRTYYGALGAEATARIYHAIPSAPVNDAAVALLTHSLVRTGRPSELAELHRAAAPDIAPYIDYVTVVAAALGEIDTAFGSAAVPRLRARMESVGEDDSRWAHGQCATALWEQRSGPARYSSAAIGRFLPSCAAALDLSEAWRSRTPDVDARIALLDSLLRSDIANSGTSQWFENRILARVHEERGDRRATLDAIRLRMLAFGSKWTDAGDLRIEGRLAAMQGDTAGAIDSYLRYLSLRRDADPSLIPQRDSVQSALNALRRTN